MESLDLGVLGDALAWRQAGHAVTLVTVVQTWGSAPRRPGALLAVRDDGVVSGSVSGGCVEDDLIARVKAGEHNAAPSLIVYGVSQEEAARFGLPCGGTLRLVQEPLHDSGWVRDLLERTARNELVARTLSLATGQVRLAAASRDDSMRFDGTELTTLFGPKWRLLLVGAGQLSQAVARMAQMLDFEVIVCDPREEYSNTLAGTGARHVPGMPDDVVRDMRPDAHSAIVALTHDPKLDDLALMEALRSDAFYIGALGSSRNQAARKLRLAEHFGMTEQELSRLHGPVGLRIGARTPAEIAVSVLGQIVECKNSVAQTARLAGCAVT